MRKRGMSLVTLAITTIVILGVFGVTMLALTKTGAMQSIERTSENMDLLNFQELANMAYSSIYFDNLRQGIRRELTAEEVRARMIENGAEEIKLRKYDIKVKDGDVFVSIKEEK